MKKWFVIFFFCFFQTFSVSVFAAPYIFLSVPNGPSAESEPYRNHTYTYYIYESDDGRGCAPPKDHHLVNLGQYYESSEGVYQATRLPEDVEAYVGEPNCVCLAVTSGHPGAEKAQDGVDGFYVTNNIFPLSADNNTQLAFPFMFHGA